jgi:hypothetical protein
MAGVTIVERSYGDGAGFHNADLAYVKRSSVSTLRFVVRIPAYPWLERVAAFLLYS